MGKCIIFCAGECTGLVQPVLPGDLILAADGGLRHVSRLGLTADEILGDFDSLGYVPENATVFPVEKDDTDAMLAVRRGLSLGFREFVIYGGLDGERLDHTLANLQTLQYLRDRGATGYLVGNRQIATVVKNGAVAFGAEAEGILSVFCLGSDARGVTISGLQYSLENGALTGGYPLGVSNHFVGKPARISVAEGSLTLLWDRGVGFPG